MAAQPLIPVSVLDAPTQRVYAVSCFAAVQAYKLYAVFQELVTGDAPHTATLFKALLTDFAVLFVLARLRIPRLTPSRLRWWLSFTLLCALDYLLLGQWSVPLAGTSALLPVALTDAFSRQLSISEHRVRIRDLVSPSSHILGKHTIHILPHSTAKLSPASACYCIGPRVPEITIPVLFNNTDPSLLQYSVTDFETGHRQLFNASTGTLSVISSTKAAQADQLYDEDDLDDPDSGALLPSSERGRSASRRITGKRGERATQRLFQLPIRHVGRVKLERVLDRNRMDARLSASEALVVNCPTASFLDTAPSTGKSGPPMRHLCPGDSGELQVAVTGLAPLELDYHRMVPPMPATSGRSKGSAKKESLKISHISSPRFSSPLLLQNGPSNLSPAERLALARQQQHDDDYRWAVAQKVDIPVTLDLSQPGLYHYLLDTVRDGCGNVLDISNAAADSKTSRSIIQSHEVAVHQRARATFVGCSADKPLPLLRGASGRNLSVRAADGDDEGGPWSVSVHFDPDASASRHYGTAAGKPWTREMSMPGTGTAKVRVEAPGIYTIESIKGKFCDGEVGAPWTCEVVDVPPPTADVKFSSIDDQCAGPVGVKALSVLTGTPPFRLHYQVTREGGRPVRRSREIRENTRDELEFRPDQDGVFEYRFLRLDDANYKDIKLDGPVLKQVVHPLASARFVAGAGHDGAKVVVHSCSGNSASADVEFTGSGPWSLTYSVSGSGVSSTHQVDKITTPRHTLDFKLPAHIAEHGGQLTVSLVSIKDGKGCERPLATSDMTIDVRRVTPTAGFIPAKGEREIAILEGGEAILPLRLSGDGPWRISYAHEDDRRPTETALNSANAQLSVNKKGRYTIVGIHDAHCPGEVLPAQAEYRVTWRPRPTLRIAEDAGMLAKNGQYVRPPVCVGTPDAFDFFMDGHFPLRVSYEHTTQVNGDRRRQREVFSAAQRLTPLQLSTLTAGVHTYELLEVADAVYPMTKLSGSSRMLEQTVHPLPSAMFVAPSKRPSFCLHDPLTPRKDMDHPTLLLTGAAPFTVHFALRDEDSRMVRTRTAEVRNREFAVDFPDFTFDAVGSWSITATRVIDANGCEFVPAAPPVVKVDVAETASIAPVGTRDDYCVGELVEFILQGTPPWTVTYEFNGKRTSASSRSSDFARVAEKPGEFSVLSVAHQQNKCRSNVSGLTKHLHDLPSCRISEGKHFIEDLREGNQAEIMFTFSGEPPFSFTYQRTETADTHKNPRVIETHTVTGITERSYSVWTSQEGTWSVTWLQDRWCVVSIDAPTGTAKGLGRSRLALTDDQGL